MHTFEDITIHNCSPINFVSGFVQKFHEKKLRTTIITEWSLPNKNYIVSEKGRKITKISGNSWGNPILSTKPFETTPIFYFQMKILHAKVGCGGLFFGVSNTANPPTFSYSDPNYTICIYNQDNIGLDVDSVQHKNSCVASIGDVLAIVVDRIQDSILFYKNGKLAAVGKRKPSEMPILYAALWIFYADNTFEIGDFIPYVKLDNNV
jgi:hypothetical protein